MSAERNEGKTAIGLRSSWLVSTGCLGAFLALAVLAILARMPELASLLIFLLLIGLTSRLWGEHALRRVRFSVRGEPMRLFPGDETVIEWTVKNDKLLPLIWLELSLPLSSASPLWPAETEEIRPCEEPQMAGKEFFPLTLAKRFAFLMPHQTLRWSAVWIARRRGLFSPDRMKVCSGDGLGLAQTERGADFGAPSFAVYPRLQNVSVDPFLRNLWEASGDAKGYLEEPAIIKGNRGYQPTDSWKRINWRLTARGLPLSVNLPETILPKSAHFIVDGESFGGGEPDSAGFEEMLSILASVLLGLETAQVRCGLTLPKGLHSVPVTLPCGAPVEELLYALAGYDFLPPLPPEEAGGDPPPAKPPRFDIAPALEACAAAGRCYYLTRSLDRLGGGLLERLEPAALVLMPMNPPDGAKPSAFEADLLPLETLKREVRHG